jgi:RHS repeat-associated protein
VRGTETIRRKRHRYLGKEQDEESALYYYGARYYAPWIGRWSSCDPIGMAEGQEPFKCARQGFTVNAVECGL